MPALLWWELAILLFLFLNGVPSFFLWFTLGNPNLKGTLAYLQLTEISCNINSIFLFKNRTQAHYFRSLWKFHAVILQETSDHVPHISDQFMAFIGNTDLTLLLNRDTIQLDPTVLIFKVDSTSKGTWGMILLIVRGLLRPKRPLRVVWIHMDAINLTKRCLAWDLD